MTYTHAFGGSITHTSFTGYPSSAGVYHDGNPMPTGRLADNGNRPIYMDDGAAASAYNAGGIGTIVENASNDIGGGYCSSSGGTFRFRIDYSSGTLYFGRNSAGGGVVVDDGDASTWAGSIPGSLQWAQVPAAPGSASVLAGDPGEATVAWTTPDDGGLAITGYRVFYGTSPTLVGASTVDVGVVTSHLLTGLTPGLTYYFAVAALNAVTAAAGTCSVKSSIVSALLGTVPDAPTGLALTAGPGRIGAVWTAPASDGGVAISSYTVEYATDSGFTTGLVTVTGLPSSARAHTVVGLTPGTTYYFRIKAVNSVGTSAASTSANTAIPARGVLDIVQGAAVHVSGGIQVEVRSDGASPATLTLGYIAFGTGSAFVTIATLSVGASAADFAADGNPRNIALAADPAGNLYVIGRRGDGLSTVLIKRFERTATTTWVADGVNSQALASTGYPVTAFAAAYVPGSGGTPVASIFVIARRAGTVGAGALSYATLDLANIEASSGAAFIAYGSDPSWLSTPPAGAADNSATVDVARLSSSTTRLAILANGFAVVDVTNGAVAGVSKSSNGTALAASWARLVPVSATSFAIFTVSGGALSWTFYGTNGSVLGSGSYAGANAWGGAFTRQWDAYHDDVADLVTVYYVADTGARTLESIDVSAATYAAAAAVSLTVALGAASSTNAAVRIPEGLVDERRVLVAAENLLTGTKSTAAYVDTGGNVAPGAPALVDVAGFDATAAYVFAWAFGDGNPADTQTAYELQVQRVSDSVDIVATGKVASAVSSRTVAGAVLANAVNYRWRVRTYDVLDAVSAWSSYDTFTTAATGTLTITDPATDNPAGVDTSSYLVAWGYVQGDGYTQTQRRVRVIRTSDSVVLSDTTMQASTGGTHTVTGLPSDVEVRLEVSIVTNAPGTPTVTTTRLLTASFAAPMTPEVVIETAESYLTIIITNPEPSGSRPEIEYNVVDRRETALGGEYVPIARVGHDGTYDDHAIKSGVQYDYRVRGVSA